MNGTDEWLYETNAFWSMSELPSNVIVILVRQYNTAQQSQSQNIFQKPVSTTIPLENLQRLAQNHQNNNTESSLKPQ